MDNIRKELVTINNRFIMLYRQKRYPEAIREAEKGLKLARESGHPHDSYKKTFQNNIRFAFREYARTVGDYSGETRKVVVPAPAKKGLLRKLAFCILFLVTSLACTVLILGIIILPCSLDSLPGSFKGNFSVASRPVASEEVSCPDAVAREKFISKPHELKESVLLEVPHIMQKPELPRGCEVTSLAMLLQYAGIDVDKMTLAREIVKEPALYRDENGNIYHGNPYRGFVGDMYSFAKPGYGVYHGPVRELMNKYLPGQTIDLTGCDFKDIKVFLSHNVPVWVIANTTFSQLEPSAFETWQTSAGAVQITYHEHAVLLTGYDGDYIYFNDPLRETPNRKVEKDSFLAAWKQMGQQAVAYLPY